MQEMNKGQEDAAQDQENTVWEQEAAKVWEKLGIENDFIFGKVMQDEALFL